MTYVRQAAALSARLMAAPLGLRLEGGPLSRLFEATGFELGDASHWTAAHAASFCLLVVTAFEFLSRVVPLLFVRSGAIPARGRHHDVLDWKDTLCLSFNRCASVPFTYHYLKAAWVLPAVKWYPAQASAWNTVVALPLLFLTYDFFYSAFHRALHLQSVYKLVHKHHHRQQAPSRGNTDAVNVHPFEFVVGEYLHLLAVVLVCRALGELHVSALLAFIVLGGMAASLNHTRLDVRIWGGRLFEVRAHDVHHRLPKSNYGQYTMVWDRLLGTYRPYSTAQQGPGGAPALAKAE